MATTASLELINPYAKFGLKRRPTYEEIVGLIGENDSITGKLPNRDATFFKASPQGSFFDGSDHLELLKDQEMRILDRQMREAMMKQEARRNGHTYAVHRRNTEPATTTDDIQPAQPEEPTIAPVQTELQQRAQQATQRQQEAQEQHRNFITQGASSIFNRLMLGRTPSTDTPDSPELIPDDEMMTARESQLSEKEKLITSRIDELHPDIQPEFKQQAFEILYSVRDRQPRIFANNLTEMSKVVNDLYIIQLIKATELEEFSHLTRLHKNAKGDVKKPITDQIAQMYGDLVYYKYIAKPQQVIGATTKKMAKPPSRAAGSGES